MVFYKEDILEEEHQTLCDLLLGEPVNDFVIGEAYGILHFVSNLLIAKKEGDI